MVRNRIRSFDATSGTQATDALDLYREAAAGMTPLSAPSRPGVAVLDDTNPNAYYDAGNPQGSVVVAGTGTRIEVVQSTSTGLLTLQVREGRQLEAGGARRPLPAPPAFRSYV